MRRLGPIFVLCAAGAACGGDDADVEGEYTIALTNRDNGCQLENWQVGAMSSGIPVVITQEGSEVSASVEGGAGVVLDIALGSHIYSGSIDGDDLFLELFGTRAQAMNTCSYTFNSVIDARASGDALEGRIEYRAVTNGSPDCASLEGCVSFQEFNGTRPPT